VVVWTPLEKAFDKAQKMIGLRRDKLHELAAKPDEDYSVAIKLDG
jgi:hypothetical protein